MGFTKFQKTEEVAHIQNIGQKLIVVDIKWKYAMVSTGQVLQGKDGKPEFEKVKKRLIDGVQCEWWDGDGKLQRQKFHSELLCPWAIAENGQEAVDEYVENMKLQKYEHSNKKHSGKGYAK